MNTIKVKYNLPMNIATTKELLKTIQAQLIYGDIGKIAILAETTREYTGKVLDPERHEFSEKVIDTAVEFLAARKIKQENQTEQLTS